MTFVRTLALLAVVAAGAAQAQTENQRRRAELEQTLNAFADRYATHIVAATSAIEKDNPSAEHRRLAHLIKVGSVSSMYDIATEPDPVLRVLDMVLMVTLQSYLWIDEDQAEKMFGERAEILRRAIRQMRVEVWALAGSMAPADQLQQLDEVILDWRRRNPELSLVAYTRLSDVSGVRHDATIEEIKRATGLFAEVADATRAADDVRLLAERVFFAMKRMPYILNWQAEALVNETLAKPEIKEALQAARAVQKIPEQITAEREALVGALEDRGGKVSALLGEVRKTTADAEGLVTRAATLAQAAERLSVNVRDTTKTVDGILLRRAAVALEGEKPFDIEPYLKAAAEVNQTIAGLNSVLVQLDMMTHRRVWAPALQDTRQLFAERVDDLFWRALVLIVVFFLLLMLYRWVASRLSPHSS
jgi:hypothetical protein